MVNKEGETELAKTTVENMRNLIKRIIIKIRMYFWKRSTGRCETCKHYVPVWFRAEGIWDWEESIEGWRNYGCGRCMKKDSVPFAGGETAFYRGCRKWEKADDAPWRSYKPCDQNGGDDSGNAGSNGNESVDL